MSWNLIQNRLAQAVIDLRTGIRREDGQGLIEYALIVSLISIVAIVALALTGTNITSILNKIASDV